MTEQEVDRIVNGVLCGVVTLDSGKATLSESGQRSLQMLATTLKSLIADGERIDALGRSPIKREDKTTGKKWMEFFWNKGETLRQAIDERMKA